MKQILHKLALTMATMFAAITASAYDFEVDGIYYNLISISLDNLTCEVTKGDNKYEGAIVIPSYVTYKNRQFSVATIGREAFRSSAITSVIIPDSVTEIQEYAFSGCRSLTSVTIGNSVTEIQEYAFSGCSSLTFITIPDSVTEIKYNVFEDCSSLASVYIPNSVTIIGGGAFSGCSSLTSITIPDSVTKIQGDTFKDCSSLTSITIPDSVTEIGRRVFKGCSSLNSVTISDSVTEIGPESFSGCKSLEFIKLPNNLKTIEYSLFNGCESLKTLDIPGSITKIYQYMRDNFSDPIFTFDSSLINFRLLYSEEILAVGYCTHYSLLFENYYWDSSWTNSIKTLYIDRPLASYITVPNLERLELGSSIKKVEVKDINKLAKLETIESLALVPPTLPIMSNSQYMDLYVFVPEEALEAYKADENWGKFWNLQASGVDGVKADSKKAVIGRYDINGMAVSEDYQGLVIVKFSDGTCTKMLNRYE